jgi:hypothetical protein
VGTDCSLRRDAPAGAGDMQPAGDAAHLFRSDVGIAIAFVSRYRCHDAYNLVEFGDNLASPPHEDNKLT